MKQEKNKRDTLRARMAYGLTDVYGGGAFVVIGTFYTVFLTKSLGMPTALAGTIPLIGKFWDAITDPIMGNICERTSSKMGAKRFWMTVGGGISALTFLLMWVVLPSESMAAKYLFYMLMYMLFSTGFTIVMVPYNGLLPDMVDDYTVRSRFTGTRTICSTFGAILAGLIPTLVIRDNTNAGSYFTVGLIFAVIFCISIYLSCFGTWERQKPVVKVPVSKSFVQSMTVYKSHSFRIFMIIFLFGQGAADFVTGLAVYYVDDVLNAYGGGRFTYLMATLLVAQFLGTILFSAIMPHTSKKFPIYVGYPVRIAATLAMFAFSYEGAPFMAILVLSFIIGLGMAASTISIYAILADMTDVDELITSVNRPGICSAMATFIRKICTGLTTSIIGILLAMAGYDEVIAAAGGRQSAATQSGIACIYILAPTIMLVIAIAATVMLPMTKKEFDMVRREIARRRGEDTSLATPEEIAACEKVTGFAYKDLWNPENTLTIKKITR